MPRTEKKLTRSKSGLKIVPIKDSERSPLELPEPAWVKDMERTHCIGCEAKFDFFRRRHHCRRCGQIFCDMCCSSRISLPRMCFLDPVRICKNCVDVTEKERKFYESGLQLLQMGRNMLVSFSDSADDSSFTQCAMSPDHRYFLMPGSIHPSVPFHKLTGNLIFNEMDSPTGFSFTVRGDDLCFQLETTADNKGDPTEFLEALKLALDMTEEARPVIGTGC